MSLGVRVDAATGPTYTTFAGEGVVKRLAQGAEAVMGVAAHEASNLRVMEAQAARNDREVVSKSIEIQFSYNAQTGKLEVVGGRSHMLHRDKEDGSGDAGAARENGEPGEAGKKTGSGAGAVPAGEPQDEAAQELQLLDDLASRLESQLGTLDGKLRTEEEQGRLDVADRLRDKKAEVRQKIEDLERQRKQVEAQQAAAQTAKQLEEVNDVVNKAVTDSTQAALGLAKGAANAKHGGGGDDKPQDAQDDYKKAHRKIGGGVFTPSFTLSGFFVNTAV